eukprot:m.146180 g.146180  ORF g.146180 m.146180 type:complete len:232 (+) comp24303_c0_seq8:447-1142(+)
MEATARQIELSLSMDKTAFGVILHFLRTGTISGVDDTTVFQLCLTEGKRLLLDQFLQALNQQCPVTRNKYYGEKLFFDGARLSFCNVANNEFLTSSETMLSPERRQVVTAPSENEKTQWEVVAAPSVAQFSSNNAIALMSRAHSSFIYINDPKIAGQRQALEWCAIGQAQQWTPIHIRDKIFALRSSKHGQFLCASDKTNAKQDTEKYVLGSSSRSPDMTDDMLWKVQLVG